MLVPPEDTRVSASWRCRCLAWQFGTGERPMVIHRDCDLLAPCSLCQFTTNIQLVQNTGHSTSFVRSRRRQRCRMPHDAASSLFKLAWTGTLFSWMLQLELWTNWILGSPKRSEIQGFKITTSAPTKLACNFWHSSWCALACTRICRSRTLQAIFHVVTYCTNTNQKYQAILKLKCVYLHWRFATVPGLHPVACASNIQHPSATRKAPNPSDFHILSYLSMMGWPRGKKTVWFYLGFSYALLPVWFRV